MPDIVHDFPITAPIARVFAGFTKPADLDAWWTERSEGEPRAGAEYVLWFGPEYEWRAVLRRCEPNAEFEFEMTHASPDWIGTRIGATLSERDGMTWVRFHHTGWPKASEHYRISCYCWAMYLRILKRHLEHGERVPFARRLDV